MARLIVVLCLAVSISCALSCRGNREDKNHECRGNEVCINGACKEPCGSGWIFAIANSRFQETCQNHDFCQQAHCKSECGRGPNEESCKECHRQHECHDSFCCKRG